MKASAPEVGTRGEATNTVRYRDRETGELGYERVFGADALHFLYETRRGGLLRTGLRRRAVSRLYGLLQRRGASRRRIPDFVAGLGIDASEAELPLEAYRSLDDFFTRRLKPGVRPVDPDPRVLVFPADGRVLVYPRLDGVRLRVKGCSVDLDELLGDREAASRFRDGTAVVVRLAPADYHRFHFPDGGEAGSPRPIRGPLESVHAIALDAGSQSLHNKREVTWISSRGFGQLAIVEVGAMLVGTIVQTYAPGPVTRGQEKGYFRFGGSTVVLLLEPGRLCLDADLIEASAAGLETRVKMGTRIGEAP